MSARNKVYRYFAGEHNKAVIRLIDQGKAVEAISAFQNHRSQGLTPTQVSISKIVGAFSRKGLIKEAESIFQTLEEEGIKPNLITYSTMIKSYCTKGLMSQARSLFDKMKQTGIPPNNLVCNTLIHGYAQNANIREAEEIIQLMKADNLVPDIVTHNTLLNAYVRIGKFDIAKSKAYSLPGSNISWDKYTYSIMIRGFCRKGNLKEALALVDQMKQMNIEVSPIIYSTLINTCANMKKMDEAENILDSMAQQKLDLNLRIFAALIFGYANLGDFDRAWEVYEKLISSGLKPDNIVFIGLAQKYAEFRRVEEMQKVFDEMKHHGITKGPEFWNIEAAGYAYNNDIQGCLKTIGTITLKNYSVSVRTLSQLINAYVNQGRVQEAKKLLLQMKKRYHCKPDVASYNYVIKGLAATGNIEVMMDLYDDMDIDNVKPSSVTLMYLLHGITKIHSDTEVLIYNLAALLSSAKDSRLYVNRGTVAFLIGLLASVSGEEKIRTAISLLEQLESHKTAMNAHVLCSAVPFIDKDGSEVQKQQIQDMMTRWNVSKDQLQSAREEQRNINSLSVESLTKYIEANIRSGKIDDTEYALSQLRHRGKELPEMTNLSLLYTYLHRDHCVEESQFQFTLMKENGAKHSFEVFGMLDRQRKSK